MIHTSRRRKREERRKRIGLSPHVTNQSRRDSREQSSEQSTPAHSYNHDEQLNLSASSYTSIITNCLLAADRSFSASMATVGTNFATLNFIFNICEIFGNGIIWMGLGLYYCWYGKSEFTEHSVNFLYGLIVDLVVVGTLKVMINRKRPTNKKGESGAKSFDFGPDQYSFPSGHSSRAVFIACFLTKEFKIRKQVTIIRRWKHWKDLNIDLAVRFTIKDIPEIQHIVRSVTRFYII